MIRGLADQVKLPPAVTRGRAGGLNDWGKLRTSNREATKEFFAASNSSADHFSLYRVPVWRGAGPGFSLCAPRPLNS
jgi:hypothetical protein